jgi:branched-chain amino acid transport system ATP-binding protein
MPEPHGSTAVSAGKGTGAGTAPGGALLEVEGLTAAYGPVRALDAVTLSAEAGRITAVLGANGAGKTTLLRTISGLVRPQAGRVRLGGEDITRAAVEAMVGKGMAHVPEGRGVIAELTVDENLRVGSLFRGKVGKDEFDRVYDTFPRIAERRDNPAHTLSGGERQMLVIGRVLLVEQNARSALSVADVGVVLNLGRVVVTDSARTLMADEGLRHAYLGF